MKRRWLVRLGRHGEGEKQAQEQSLLSIDSGVREDLRACKDRWAVLSAISHIHPDEKAATLRNYAAQVNQLINVARAGALVVSR